MAFQQDTSGQGYSPDPSSRGQKGLGSRLGLTCASCRAVISGSLQIGPIASLATETTDGVILV